MPDDSQATENPYAGARQTNRIGDTRVRSIDTVRRGIETLRGEIAVNGDLAADPAQAGSARKRIATGQREMAILEAELDALDAGDTERAIDLHRLFPSPAEEEPPDEP